MAALVYLILISPVFLLVAGIIDKLLENIEL